MANELQVRTGVSSQSPYALIESTVGTIWSTTGSALVAYVTADLANYDVALTERGSTGRYYGTFPTGLTTPGQYRVRYFVPAVANTPTEYDVFVGEDLIDWTGTAAVGSGNANLTSVNEISVGGVGTAVNPWGPA